MYIHSEIYIERYTHMCVYTYIYIYIHIHMEMIHVRVSQLMLNSNKPDNH